MTLRQATHELVIATRARGLYEFTREVRQWLAEPRIAEGVLTLFIRHTSASLLIQENADPEVQRDLERFFARLVRDGDPLFEHTTEGEDDMPAHVRAALTQTSVSIPILGGELMLGAWQGIYLYEHRYRAQRRSVAMHVIGDG